METILQIVDKENVKEEDLCEAGMVIQKGGLVAFPTETVYGLGGDALDVRAAEKIYAAKGRPSDNPLIVHVADIEALNVLAVNIPKEAYMLAEAFWPGPLTMILQKNPIVPDGTTGGLPTVAIRMPEHPVALALIKSARRYIAAPSANTSGRPSPTEAKHVKEDLNGKIDWIVDGGSVGIGIESTIVDLTSDVPMILRPGYITQEMLSQVIGEVLVDPAILEKSQQNPIKAKAPGMKYRHYAPQGHMMIVEGEDGAVVSEIKNRVKDIFEQEEKAKIAILASDETLYQYDDIKCHVVNMGSRNNLQEVAVNLYGVLREMDEMQMQYIFAESFEGTGFATAVMNRMQKAAGYEIVQAQ